MAHIPNTGADGIEPSWYKDLKENEGDNIKMTGTLRSQNNARQAEYLYMAGDMDKAVEAALEVVIKAWVPSILERKSCFVYSIVPDTDPLNFYTGEKWQDIADVIVEAACYTNGLIFTNGLNTGNVTLIADSAQRSNVRRERRKCLTYGSSKLVCIGFPKRFIAEVTEESYQRKWINFDMPHLLNSDHDYFIFYEDKTAIPHSSQQNVILSPCDRFRWKLETRLKAMRITMLYVFPSSSREPKIANHSLDDTDIEAGNDDFSYDRVFENKGTKFGDVSECKLAIMLQIWPYEDSSGQEASVQTKTLALQLFLLQKPPEMPGYLKRFYNRGIYYQTQNWFSNAFLFIVINNLEGCDFLLRDITNILMNNREDFLLEIYKEMHEPHLTDLLQAIPSGSARVITELDSVDSLTKKFFDGFFNASALTTEASDRKERLLSYFQLFVCAILCNRYPNLTDFCLEHCKRPLLFALAGVWLSDRLHSYFERRHDLKMAKAYADMKIYFVKFAKDLFEVAEKDSFEMTNRLLKTKVPMMSDLTYLDIVEQTKTPKLFTQRNIERYILRSWKQAQNDFSPQTKSIVHAAVKLSTILFYAYVLLFSIFPNRPSLNEGALWIMQVVPAFWHITMYCRKCAPNEAIPEICRPVKSKRDKRFLLESSYIMIAACMRMIDLAIDSRLYYSIAVILLCVNFVMQSLKLIKFFALFSFVGPKALIFLDMTQEFFMFAGFFMLFLFTFSVSSYRLAYEPSDFELTTILSLFRQGPWEMFGVLDDDILSGNVAHCALNETSSMSFECHARSATLIVFMTAYLFTATIVVNLLIAVWNYIFEQKNEEAENVWRYQRYLLLLSYENAAILPWPCLILQNHKKNQEYQNLNNVEARRAAQKRTIDEFSPFENGEEEIFEQDIGEIYFRAKKLQVSFMPGKCDQPPIHNPNSATAVRKEEENSATELFGLSIGKDLERMDPEQQQKAKAQMLQIISVAALVTPENIMQNDCYSIGEAVAKQLWDIKGKNPKLFAKTNKAINDALYEAQMQLE